MKKNNYQRDYLAQDEAQVIVKQIAKMQKELNSMVQSEIKVFRGIQNTSLVIGKAKKIVKKYESKIYVNLVTINANAVNASDNSIKMILKEAGIKFKTDKKKRDETTKENVDIQNKYLKNVYKQIIKSCASYYDYETYKIIQAVKICKE